MIPKKSDYFKLLGPDRMPCHGGNGQWPEPGIWTPRIERIHPCQSGYHVCDRAQILDWMAPQLWVVEPWGITIAEDTKIVCQQARLLYRVETWNERSLRLFAADCAERVVNMFERYYPSDDRPRKAIEATRKFAHGEISRSELAAARAAASDAARAAAWDAASAAASAAAWDAASAAASDAASAAAWDAARDAAWDAVWDAEQRWQHDRLWEYITGERS